MKTSVRLLVFAWSVGVGVAGSSPPGDPVELTLTAGTGMVVDCPGGIARVAASNPEVADAVTGSGVYHLTVEPNMEPLRKLLREAFPDEQIDLRASRDSLALVGNASSQAVADRALTLIAASVKGAVSNLAIAPPAPENQVLLRVRFAELNRTAAREFGVNLLSTGALNTPGQISTGQFPGGGVTKLRGVIPGSLPGTATEFNLSDVLNIFAFRPDLDLASLVRNLETRGLLQVLAEPNLVATSGKEASFLAGGEFPVPIAQGGATAGAITVQYREFGIRLSFTPQVTAQGTIRLHVKPEVSSLDWASGVTLSGFKIPALSARRMETDVELRQGESFVIAGLIDDRVVENLSRLPGLSQIPVLGALFRSRSVNKSKTELIVLVTPATARPAQSAAGPVMPRPFLEAPEGR